MRQFQSKAFCFRANTASSRSRIEPRRPCGVSGAPCLLSHALRIFVHVACDAALRGTIYSHVAGWMDIPQRIPSEVCRGIMCSCNQRPFKIVHDHATVSQKADQNQLRQTMVLPRVSSDPGQQYNVALLACMLACWFAIWIAS